MNAKNLPLKLVLFVLLPIAASVFAFMQQGLKQGIDLRGGHSLVFELRTNDKEKGDLEAQLAALKTDSASAVDKETKDKIDEQIKGVEASLSRLKEASGSESDLPNKVIAILKNRIDPHGLLSLEWRPMGKNRIEVRMPAARKETQQFKLEYLDALTKLEASNIQPSSIRRVMAASGPARQEQINTIVPSGGDQAKQLDELATLRDKMNALQAKAADLLAKSKAPDISAEQSEKLRSEADEAMKAAMDLGPEYSDKMEQVAKGNVNISQFQAIERLYVSGPERDTLKKEDVQKRTTQYERGLNEVLAKNPARSAEIKNVDALYRKWADSRQGLDDPSDLKRLIAKAGVLEFRIAPLVRRDSSHPNALTIDPETAQKYMRDLQANGPDAGKGRNDPWLWFPTREEKESWGGLVTATWGGKEYVLLSNSPQHSLLRGAGDEWRLAEAYPGQDRYGRPAVDFRMDSRGARLFYNLTSTHKESSMAILLDDEVYSAPYINEAISDRGIIEGRFTQQEVKELVQTLEAGSLPARIAVEDTPGGKVAKAVSENTFGPTFGQVNLRMALNAGLIGTLAIAVFMIIYYRMGGALAVFAMLMNLVLVIGAMSLLNAVMTLPGIAGIILSIGMAVDANVLIYERLREEQERGQSIRMALKLAYERAFSAIFDSNITTLLTCLILGWLGTEEVRGFAITLGLGVLFNLFTAVTVTRWIFQFMLEKRMVNRPLHLMKIIGVPKIDWMAKRYWFWGFSLLTAVMGIISFAWELKAGNIWGIEFSSGTQSTVRLHDDAVFTDPKSGKPALASDGLIGELFHAQAGKNGFEALKDARVEQVIDPNRVQTFLKDHFPEAKFQQVQSQQKVTFAEWTDPSVKLEKVAFELLDGNKDGVLDKGELEKLPSNSYQINTIESNADKVNQVAQEAFGREMVTRTKLDYKPAPAGQVAKLGAAVGSGGAARINDSLIKSADKDFQGDLMDYDGGAMFVIQDVSPATTKADLLQRIREARLQPDFSSQLLNPTSVLELNPSADNTATAFAILVKPGESIGRTEAAWKDFADKEGRLVTTALTRQEAIETANFDAAIASDSATTAFLAVVLGWVVIIIYLWIRFGSFKWGAAAVVCILHDLIIIIGMVAVSNWVDKTVVGRVLDIQPFKIDLVMIAAFLTIIGYSVNDTIVVFDRIRENRGKLLTVSPTIINNSINQTLSRTILTSTLTWITVFVMYVWGGAGIHAFNYAMLIGILFGTYSSIAVAAPILMGFRTAMTYHHVEQQPPVIAAK